MFHLRCEHTFCSVLSTKSSILETQQCNKADCVNQMSEPAVPLVLAGLLSQRPSTRRNTALEAFRHNPTDGTNNKQCVPFSLLRYMSLLAVILWRFFLSHATIRRILRVKCPMLFFFQVLNKFQSSGRISIKVSDIKFHENLKRK
jgi:hypothetical protein